MLIGIFKGAKIPWDIFFFYTLLLLALSVVFLSFGFLISSIVKNQEMGQGVAFLLWLILIAFLDIALIGLMLKSAIRETTIYAIALLNPIELFRIAAISLFDPNLAVIGPAAYFILDKFTPTMFIIYTFGYSIMISILCFFIGYYVFSKKDLV
ncbi:ABC transporter permease subunit [Campylobacter sp. RM16191]|uniref:ABC transporter permease subunit n=1 Tax=Campylobacter sp. RM16191 TaxID=1705728 RepID=UPI001B8D6EF9|nr:ABC transporter permease subunit [Campylobacter sp. RM16191]